MYINMFFIQGGETYLSSHCGSVGDNNLASNYFFSNLFLACYKFDGFDKIKLTIDSNSKILSENIKRHYG